MNKKNRNRFKRMPLECKYRHKGIAKTNSRKRGHRRGVVQIIAEAVAFEYDFKGGRLIATSRDENASIP